MAVIIDEIVTEPVATRPTPAEPRDVPQTGGAQPPTMDDLRFEFLRDAQRKARLWVD
ncbi:MAG: hypothetical protein RL481_701 [Pseudomonadota bacterium]|jgi:hypothetical protein